MSSLPGASPTDFWPGEKFSLALAQLKQLVRVVPIYLAKKQQRYTVLHDIKSPADTQLPSAQTRPGFKGMCVGMNKLSIPFLVLRACFHQAIERGPAQLNPAVDEQGEASEAAQQSTSEADNMEVRGSRFSKSAEERQSMLKQRKEEMLQQARRFVHCLKVST